ncbi:MAG TPA: MTAP family purine nucleoside phosphorylase [Candidatus Aquicultor sp.]
MLGVITGSGLYDLPGLELKEQKVVRTPFGGAPVSVGSLGGKSVAFIARHGRGHALLPNTINYRANIFALKETGVRAIVATSVVGVVDKSMSLGTIVFFDDIYFMDNRLPNGEICTVFTQPSQAGRAHYIFASPFSSTLREVAQTVARNACISHRTLGIYGHVNGPRFNSRAETSQLKALGVTAISQTCGPEAVLAGELEIPYLLIGFGIDYANGVSDAPTPIEVLDANLKLGSQVMPVLIKGIVSATDVDTISAEGFLYRFE